jgi:peptidoglycan/LPS O-acetylase OafA/YrhL
MTVAEERRTVQTPGAVSPGAVRAQPLDGLRTVAIAFVVLFHLHVPLFSGGFIGVNIFFALSGYLITCILLRESTTTGRISLGRFWLRRMIRLYPTLLVVVVVVVCLWGAISLYSSSNVDAWTDALLALSYSGNIARWIWHRSMGPLAQTWSLAMEEQFYLVWPPLLALLLAGRVRRAILVSGLGVAITASAVLGWLLYRVPGGGATPDIYFSPILNVAPLLSGALLAVLCQSPRVTARLAARLGTVFTLIGLGALVAIEVSLTSNWTKQSAVVGVVLPLVGVASTLLIAGLAHRRTPVARVLALGALAWFGRNGSYGLYLWHVMVIALVLPLVPGPLGVVAAIGISVAVAIGSHYAIERPMERVRKLVTRRTDRATTQPERTFRRFAADGPNRQATVQVRLPRWNSEELEAGRPRRSPAVAARDMPRNHRGLSDRTHIQ